MDLTDASWDEHYLDEQDAVFLYRTLAEAEQNEDRRRLFVRLADVEENHVRRWKELFQSNDRPLPPHRLAFRTRCLAWLARSFGPASVLPFVLADEGREVTAYLRLAGRRQPNVEKTARSIAAESAGHARELAGMLGREGEPWHGAGAGGYLRSIVYGFNDGLTANFGLVAGVFGADVGPHIVIISGVAGTIADALSMGASGYLAAKSQAEVQAFQVEVERQELELMPELEEDELALIYEMRGLPAEQARETARGMMGDPAQALDTKIREELNLAPPELSPLKDGIVTGAATAVGAAIPIAPFLVLSGPAAIWVSLTISMTAHFMIGAARSLFTGRGVWASGRDMFLVGFGVAAVGYLIGKLLARVM